MNKTKIEWCDQTWNPVTGCMHGCPYCYARKLVCRFGGKYDNAGTASKIHELEGQWKKITKKGRLKKAPYPFGFEPSFHKYKLDEPTTYKKPQNIFVCSMADLFGDFIPDEWIQEVLNACKKAPQHRYLFLTKNYKRYDDLISKKVLPSIINPHYYFGHSITTQNDSNDLRDWILYGSRQKPEYKNNYWVKTFMSVEPLQGDINLNLKSYPVEWVIIGAETGNRKNKIIPERGWIESIVRQCHSETGHPFVQVFMKDSLKDIWGEPLIREYPW